MSSLNPKTMEEFLPIIDTYWMNVKGLCDVVFERWDTAMPHQKIKWLVEMNSLCSRFAGFFYIWNTENGWFLMDLVRFIDSNAELKKSENGSFQQRFNVTYKKEITAVLDEFHSKVGSIYTMKTKLFFAFQIREMLKMKITTNKAIALFDDIFLREEWYQKGFEAYDRKDDDGAKGGYSLTMATKKSSYKP